MSPNARYSAVYSVERRIHGRLTRGLKKVYLGVFPNFPAASKAAEQHPDHAHDVLEAVVLADDVHIVASKLNRPIL